VLGGFYNEVVGGVTYYNVVDDGSVAGNSVTLHFKRTIPNSYTFSFTGTLIDDVLTGQMDGPYLFTATRN
jgi:hypothetical protein